MNHRRTVCCGKMAFAMMFACPVAAQSPAFDFKSITRYDNLRRLIGIILPDPDGAGVGNPRPAIRNSYDAAGRLTKTEQGTVADASDAAWANFLTAQATDIEYDTMDRKIRESVSAGGATHIVTQYAYDVAGRVECTAVRMNPAGFGSLPASACALGSEGTQGPDRITKNVYDAAGQLLRVIKAFGTPLQQDDVTYSYTANGKQATVTDANGNKASLEYDGHDRQSRWRFPSKTSVGQVSSDDYEEYGYDASGNRTSLRRRDGRTLGFTYDALNRVIAKTVPDGCAPIQVGTCTPAAWTRDVYYAYDLRGLQTYARFDSANGEGVSLSYDGFGQLISSTTSMGGANRTLGYQYDPDGNRTRITYPDGMYFTTTYDGLNRVFRMGEYANQHGLMEQQYAVRGQLQTRFVQNGSTTYSYDPIGRLSQAQLGLAQGTGNQTTDFAYNPASQILQRTRSNDAYAWNGAVNTDRAYTINGLNQYTAAGSTAFQYDANGNLIASGPTGYTYDAENRLINTSTGTSLGSGSVICVRSAVVP